MSSRWAKAGLVIAIIWVLALACQALIQSDKLSFLPQLIRGVGATSRQETLTHASTDLMEVIVTTQNGSVVLLGTDTAEEIKIEANYQAWGMNKAAAQERLMEMDTEIIQEGNRLFIRAVYATLRGQHAISYQITLPSSLAARVQTSNGAITVEDLSGKLDLTTSNGRITVSATEGPNELTARTSNGSINIAASPTGGTYNLRTSNGSVKIDLPENLGVKVSARTSNGSINLGPGQWTIAGGKLEKTRVDAQRGNGELELIVTTSNGSISLRKL
ncbi:MAG: DUF4097 domain-containing protein [Firmicutes bacterium]|nr:DUF4097 domain-containing protein [Bacillota bacterium]